MKEEWKTLPYLSDKIKISNSGQVHKMITESEEVEVKGTISNGTKIISYSGKQYPVHRLVAEAFIPNPDNLPLVLHKDGNKLNNCADNLEWSSRTDSIRKMLEKGDSSNKMIYCVELDKLFGSLRSAAYYTSLQQEFISWSISKKLKVCGLTFESVKPGDSKYSDYDVIYFSFSEAQNLIVESKSLDEFVQKLKS